MLDRLVIGTANWGRDYNGHNVPDKEQNLIMEYMNEVGIEWLEVATAYGTENIGKDFKRIVKVQSSGFKDKPECIIAHSLEYSRNGFLCDYSYPNGFSECLHGVSIDESTSHTGCMDVIEIPYSILNTSVEKAMRPWRDNWINRARRVQLFARSIFCKGKALQYFSPRECINFVLMNPRIDKVIFCVDSVDQLMENTFDLVRMEAFTHILEVDTRKF